jgi:hypothetical protein
MYILVLINLGLQDSGKDTKDKYVKTSFTETVVKY